MSGFVEIILNVFTFFGAIAFIYMFVMALFQIDILNRKPEEEMPLGCENVKAKENQKEKED